MSPMDQVQEKVKTSLIPFYSFLVQVRHLSALVYPTLQNIGYPFYPPHLKNDMKYTQIISIYF